MLYLFHGDDIDTSRKNFRQTLSDCKESDLRKLDGKSLTLESLTVGLESQSLFEDTLTIVIERLLSGRNSRAKNTEALIDKIKSLSEQQDILLWEDKELTAAQIKKFGSHCKVSLSKVPQTLFQLVDSLAPNNAHHLTSFYSSTIESYAPEVVYTMIASRLRQLIMVKDSVSPPTLQPWQIGKLTSQSRAFTMDKLLAMYKSLFAIDREIKSGLSPVTIESRIRIWLTQI